MMNPDCAYILKKKRGENTWNPEELSDRSSTAWDAFLSAPFVDDKPIEPPLTVLRCKRRRLLDGASYSGGQRVPTGPRGRGDALFTNRLAVR